MTKNEAVDSLLNWCRNEIGYHESGDNWTKYAADLEKYPDLFFGGSKQQLAWCAVWVVDAFVNVFGYERAIKMLCIPSVPCGAAGCMYAAQYYQDKYYIAIVRQAKEALEISLVKNPIRNLNMNRQCVQWVWECTEYEYKPMKFKMI